jgi:hypothetical protein
MQNTQSNIMQQNLINMMKQMQQSQPFVFDPNKTDIRMKRAWISDNISQSRSGLYAKFFKSETTLFNHVSKCNVGQIDNICDVSVVYEHSIDTAEKYADIGANNFTKNNKLNPVIVNVVGRDFIGSNYESCTEMRDEIINIRTIFCSNKTKGNIFPLKEEQCAYTSLVTVIRPKDPRMPLLNWQNTFRTGIITSCPIKHDSSAKKLSIKSYLQTLSNIESIFQCAIAMSHSVLILCPYGHTNDDNNPVDDIIKLYNFCIMKYGHKFKHIIISVPTHYPKQIYEMYLEKIVKPCEMTKEIDDKYDMIENDLAMKTKLQENIQNNTKNNNINENDIANNNVNVNENINQIDPKQFQMMVQMMNMMNKKN